VQNLFKKGLRFVTLHLDGDMTSGMSTKTLQRELLGLGKNIELLVRKFVWKKSINSVHLHVILTMSVTQFVTEVCKVNEL